MLNIFVTIIVVTAALLAKPFPEIQNISAEGSVIQNQPVNAVQQSLDQKSTEGAPQNSKDASAQTLTGSPFPVSGIDKQAPVSNTPTPTLVLSDPMPTNKPNLKIVPTIEVPPSIDESPPNPQPSKSPCYCDPDKEIYCIDRYDC